MSTEPLSQLYSFTGFPLFVLVVLLCSGACILMFSAASYVASQGRYRVTFATFFVTDTLGRFTWPLSVLIVTGLFLIANHLLIRGLAVGIWDVDGQFYPYQVLVADHARAGGFVQWDPWSNAGRPISGDPQL